MPVNPECTTCNGTGWDDLFESTCMMCEGFIPGRGGMGETLQQHRNSSAPPKSRVAEPVDDSWKRRPRWSKQGNMYFVLTPKNMKCAPGDTVTVTRADGSTAEVILGAVYDKNDWGDTLWSPHKSEFVGPTAPVAAPTRAPRSSTAAEEGMYRTTDGNIYKVQLAVHGSGLPYAKKLYKLDKPVEVKRGNKVVLRTHGFEMATGMQFKLRPDDKMSFDEAKEWGALYGACCVCGITLTNEESIELGIGPVCRNKF